MNTLKENLGDGYQQVIIGFITFIIGAIWGGMNAGTDMIAADVYWPAVIMLSGAMITLLEQHLEQTMKMIGPMIYNKP